MRPLRIRTFDRHAEHAVDPELPLCEHDATTLHPGETLALQDQRDEYGALVELKWTGRDLVVVVNHLEYRCAKKGLERVGFSHRQLDEVLS